MSEYSELPGGPGVYRVETVSGTVHIISTDGRHRLWERRPMPESVSGRYDYQKVALRHLGGQWVLGERGYLEVDDETSVMCSTWHLTGMIIRISDALGEVESTSIEADPPQ